MRSAGEKVPDTQRRAHGMHPVLLLASALLSLLLGLGAMLASSPGVRAQQSVNTQAQQAKQDAAHPAPERMSASDYARMLPPSDLGAGRFMPHGMHSQAFTHRPATPFIAASIPHNPLAPDARPIGARSCAACHALEATQASHSLHVAAFRATSTAIGAPAACEACHGPGSRHAENPAAPGLIISYTHDSPTPIDTQTQTCLACHAGGARQHWIGSVHQRRGLSCTDCHNPMVRLSAEGLLAKASINKVCSTCHQHVRVQFNRRSHMPLPEGQISCADCHNPHGSITQALLKTDTVNETCFACHADKRGPFLFEHAPVRENCLACHTPHGSNHANLLTLPVPMLCQQCHVNHGHPNDLLTRQGLRNQLVPDERLMRRGCLSCHSNIHGSNHPAGSRFLQ